MRWHREDYLRLLTFEPVEKPMLVELFGPLTSLPDEWRSQGAQSAEIDLTAFDFDYVQLSGCGGQIDVMSGIRPQVISENDQYLIQIDAFGRQTKLCKNYATIPLPINYPVADMDDWLRIKHWFTYRPERIDWPAVAAAQVAQKDGALVLAGMYGGFDLPRQLMGEEALCFAFYDQPELVWDILDTAADTACHVFGQISDHLCIDNLFVHEDMAG